MLKRYPVIAGAVAGLLLRLLFSGGGGSRWSAMAGAFIYMAPVLVGMVTVYLAELQQRRSWGYYFGAPFLATCLFILGTLALLIEGLICAIVIVPMFAILGGLGGLLMGLICRLTNWPQSTLYCAGALPLILATLGALPSPNTIGSIERSILIQAPPSIVWQSINNIQSIQSTEMDDALVHKIGVPLPMSGTTQHTSGEYVRLSQWGKHVHFEEVIQDWQPDRYMRWTYRFSDDSFPPAALDDHVLIGGHYFDLLDTSFTLLPENGGNSTRLTTQVHYRISTQFNFYANWAAQLLIGNLNEVGLRLYKSRSEDIVEANQL